jgi:hypothetical protein
MNKNRETQITTSNERQTSQDPLLLNVLAASAFIGITSGQLRGLIAAREIPVVRVGRKLFLRRVTLVRWVENEECDHKVRA